MNTISWIKETLEGRENRFLDLLADGLLWVDRSGNIVDCNPFLAGLTGRGRRLLIDARIELVIPSLKEVAYQELWEIARRERKIKREFILATETGRHLPVQATVVFFEGSGAPLILCLLDELPFPREQYELLKSTHRTLHLAAWQWDLISGLSLVTDEFYEFFDLEPQGRVFFQKNVLHLLKDRLSHEQLRELTTRIAKVQEEKNGGAYLISLALGGKKVSVKLHLEPLMKDGQVVAIRGLFKERPAAASVNRFEQLAYRTLNKSDKMIFWVEPDCSICFANEEACRSLQYNSEELRQMKILKVDKEHGQLDWEDLWKRLSKQQTLQVESLFQRKDGTVFPVEMHLIYLKVEEETLICLTASDITERRQKEARLQRALVEIKSLSRQMEAENVYLQQEISSNYNFNNIITSSPRYQVLLEQARQVAATDATVLILGETGTGKELLARAIHRASNRKDRPLIKVNCAALSSTLIESELFGHEKGAFTGADKQKSGRFELADGGTIFLDEIGEIPLELQSKLLRVLQEGEFERLGGNRTISVDVRVIAATNRKLEKMVERGAFRSDLYYRLNVFPLLNMPLRERREDIPLLVDHFLKKYCEKTGKEIDRIAAKDLQRLKQYDFPGNIRELENIIERAVILNRGSVLKLRNWNSGNQQFPAAREAEEELISFGEAQRRHILRALEMTRWRVSGEGGAADLLGLNPQTLFSKMRRLGIKRDE